MDIKCKTNPYYFCTPSLKETTSFLGVNVKKPTIVSLCARTKKTINTELCEDKFMRSPVASKNATGLLSLIGRCKNSVSAYVKNYKKNLKHTIDHKIYFAIIEKELLGKNSIDSVTHDLDKLVLYCLGFPKPFVTRFHRSISAHHVESGKKNNLRSMLCDNIASSPDFKPEKKQNLREYYASNKELQKIEGFSKLLEKYNYGENLNFEEIKNKKNNLSFSQGNIILTCINFLTLLLFGDKTTSL